VLISNLVTTAFQQAASKYPERQQAWLKASIHIGGLIPNSLLMPPVQKDGWLDVVLQAMEDELAAQPKDASQHQPLLALNFQMLLSEVWIGRVYETVRLLADRKLAPDTDQLKALLQDLRLVRVPLEKHEIASQGQLQQPLQMQRRPPKGDSSDLYDLYEYSKTDPRRSHIMPAGYSQRGSIMWGVLDLHTNQEKWVERRAFVRSVLVDLELTAVRSEPAPSFGGSTTAAFFVRSAPARPVDNHPHVPAAGA
jgi:hypothetical protein